MTFTVAGYPGEVNKVEFARMMSLLGGYQAVEGLSLQPSGSSRGVEVTFTAAVVPGVYVEQSAPDVVNAPENLSGDPRRDRIILKHDWGLNTTTLEVKAGTPGTNPQLPAVTRDPGTLWEQTIGHLNTGSGQGAYNTADIEPVEWRPESGPLILPENVIAPFASDRRIILREDSGLMLYSVGSLPYRPLRINQEHVANRALLSLVGNDDPERFVSAGEINFATTMNTNANIGGFGFGSNTAERILPLTGLYDIMFRTNVRRTGTVLDAQIRVVLNGTPGDNTSGNIILWDDIDMHSDGQDRTLVAGLHCRKIPSPLNAGDILKFIFQAKPGGGTVAFSRDNETLNVVIEYKGPG